MPYKSEAQRKWAHTKTGMKELGKKMVEEYDKATKGKSLPQKVKPKITKTVKKGK